jgi:hypothetical protein
MRMVECRHCHYKYEEDVEKIHEEGEAFVIRNILTSRPMELSKTKKCVDLVCPNCKREFEFCWEE